MKGTTKFLHHAGAEQKNQEWVQNQILYGKFLSSGINCTNSSLSGSANITIKDDLYSHPNDNRQQYPTPPGAGYERGRMYPTIAYISIKDGNSINQKKQILSQNNICHCRSFLHHRCLISSNNTTTEPKQMFCFSPHICLNNMPFYSPQCNRFFYSTSLFLCYQVCLSKV